MDDYVQPAPTWDDFVVGWDLGLYPAPVLCGIVAGIALGYLGVFIVLRRTVFVTAAVSQAAGLGVALSFWLSIHLGFEVHPVLGAIALAFAMTGLFTVSPDRLRLSRESVLGFAYVGCWAAAILVGDRIRQESHDIASILFGTAVLVRDLDLWLVLGAAGLVAVVHLLGYRGFVFTAFDPQSARVQGLPVRTLDLTSWILIALTVSVATRALGVLPVFAFAVLPAMAGLALFDRVRHVLFAGAFLGGLSGGAGYLAAFFLELPVGASQAGVATVFFVLCAPVRLFRRRTVV